LYKGTFGGNKQKDR